MQVSVLVDTDVTPEPQPDVTRDLKLCHSTGCYRRLMAQRIALIAVSFVLFACASEQGGTSVRATPSTAGGRSTTTTASSSTLPSLPPGLPNSGIASQVDDDLRLYDLEGRLLAELENVTVASGRRPGGPLLAYAWPTPPGETAYRLFQMNPTTSEWLEIDEAPPDGPDVWPNLAPPPHPSNLGEPVGHWRWALLAPDSSVTLAQWSGECEVPHAFFIDDTGTRSVLGGDWTTEPNTSAGGWLPDGRALVGVAGEPACGTGSLEPGLYAITPHTNVRQLLIPKVSGILWSTPSGARSDETAGVRHTLEVHCGVLSTWYGGELWLADPPLGDHNPPEGWDENRVDGELIVTDEGSAEFRGDDGERATFRRALDGESDPNEGCE